MTKKNQNSIRRFYTVKEISVVFVCIIAIVLIFDSTGLKSWANNLDVGPSRTFFVSVTEPLDSFTSNLMLEKPRNGLRDAFFSIMGKKREAGFTLANSGGEIPASFDLSPGADNDIGSWMDSPNVGWNNDGNENPVDIPAMGTTGIYSTENPLSVLLIGDSMMGDGFGIMIERAVEADDAMTSRRYPRHSSGLSRPDYYNWPAQVNQIFSEGQYDAVIVILGTNDAQSFDVDGVVHERFDEGWSEIYSYRLRAFLELLGSRTQRIYWVGMPPMRETGYNGRMKGLNGFFEMGCAENHEAVYVSSGEILGNDAGEFTSYLDINGSRVNVRNTDGIHLTRAGGGLVADRVMDLIRGDFIFEIESEINLPQN